LANPRASLLLHQGIEIEIPNWGDSEVKSILEMKGRYSVAVKTFFISRTLTTLADRIIAELNSTIELHVPNAFPAVGDVEDWAGKVWKM
jgi:hypothetical protein